MLVKAFRLFVSSTFADFAQEREVLHSKVFPSLDAYCAAKGYQFLPLDLRWGINDEAQRDQRTAEICLGEVSAAKGFPRPNFLIMIGNRYGWVPLPYAIAQDEFEAVVAWHEGHGQSDAVRELRLLYRRDDNCLLPRGLGPRQPSDHPLTGAYVLGSREDELNDLRAFEAWASFEARTRHALQQAAEDLRVRGQIDEAAHDKYFRSLTEQEIVRGFTGTDDRALVSATSQGAGAAQAIAFFRELAAGAGDKDSAKRESGSLLQWLTGHKSRDVPPPSGNAEDKLRLDALRSCVQRFVPRDNIVTTKTVFGADGKLDETYLSDFAATIEHKLMVEIDRHVAEVSTIEQATDFALASERDGHRTFAEQKRHIFVGRQRNLQDIAAYLTGAADHPLIVHGRSGLGKSALLARAIADAEMTGEMPVIYRFIGASAASSDVRSLLISLVDDLAAQDCCEKPEQFDDDANKFTDQIRELLSSINAPVTIVLDGLDQLRKPYRLGWMPYRLPSPAKLVVSVLDDDDYATDSAIYRSLRQRLPPDAFLRIGPLGAAEGQDILTELEGTAQRRLQAAQQDYIIKQFERADASPLYLRVAFEIARNWRSTAAAGEVPYVLAESTIELIAQFIHELTDRHHHEPALVGRVLGYLVAAKNGLSAKELMEILSRDPNVMRAISSEKYGVRAGALPASVWARLERQLAPFLTEKRVDEQPLLQFFHRQVDYVARQMHYETAKSALHAALAAYFEARAGNENGHLRYDKRSLSELPYQLHHADQSSRLGAILMSPDWMQQKLLAHGCSPLIDDYQYARTEAHKLVGRTLQLTAGILTRDSRQLGVQLHGRLMTSADDTVQSFCSAIRQDAPRPSILTQRPSLTPPGSESARLEGHAGPINKLRVLSDGRLASGSSDSTIRIWDPTTGVETGRLEGHTGSIASLQVLSDGQLVSTSDRDQTIRIWDVETGSETARMEYHPAGWFGKLKVLLDGRLAASWEDNSIRLFDTKAGEETARLNGHNGRVTTLELLSDGMLASGSEDSTIRIWDVTRCVAVAVLKPTLAYTRTQGRVDHLAALQGYRLASAWDDHRIRVWDLAREEMCMEVDAYTDADIRECFITLSDSRIAFTFDYDIILMDPLTGHESARLQGHTDTIRALRILDDDRLASSSRDRTVRIWDLRSHTELVQLEGHTADVTAIEVLSDGRLASGSDDRTVRLWYPRTANEALWSKHTGEVNALAVMPDGQLASCSSDKTIRLWDRETGVENARLEGHTGSITALAVLPDGGLVSSSDDGAIWLWRGQSGREMARQPKQKNGAIAALAALPDGRLVAGGADNRIWVWDFKTASWRDAIDRSSGFVHALAGLPDFQLASSSHLNTIREYEHAVRLWDLRRGTEAARLQGHTASVKAIVLTSDGRVASGSADTTIRLWDCKTGAETARYEGHAGEVMALAVVCGNRLASGSSDNTIRLWDCRSGEEIVRLEVDAPVRCLTALPDGRLVAGDAVGRLHWLEIME